MSLRELLQHFFKEDSMKEGKAMQTHNKGLLC